MSLNQAELERRRALNDCSTEDSLDDNSYNNDTPMLRECHGVDKPNTSKHSMVSQEVT